MLNSDLSAMLSQHYVTYDVNVVITSRLPERSFLLTEKPRLLLFCFTCKHAETKLKQNNFTETKHCFAFVLFQFYFSYNHCFYS